ncbi:leucine-rich repeat receptor protein kinase HPCA1-like isoform X2 [Impatiens glandulifera]|uniref:leucine-rich repeat receptor protein kinase HPCA1-like isoform X2 n=1 Tax=Impatiens glandulifera TaxID=253017 RepID=UPI001FB127E8|nr:leucine-rich repeat receptor protein kinase HPCA1-like isoform X2 [Impatiens glandulifera]
MGIREFYFLVLIFTQSLLVYVEAQTNNLDVSALKALQDAWMGTPPSWDGLDPCGNPPWEGIGCTNSRITSITLASMGISGRLTGDIASLTELRTLDLSNNKGLSGNIPPSIGNLKKLSILLMEGCSFSGEIPDTFGSLEQLVTLSLTSNDLTGPIPPSLGNLKMLHWLDVAENRLTGTIPVSTATSPGLDQLVNTKHFHFGGNQLSGTIPPTLFNSNMTLIHLLFENNQLTGSIPSTIGLLRNLEVLRLDRNRLSGTVPPNISNLLSVHEFYLSSNQLTGPIPNIEKLTSMISLDLSNNSFDTTSFPSWYSSLSSLMTLAMENTQLIGEVPAALFSIPRLQSVVLRNNKLNGTLDLGSGPSSQLQLVDLQNNSIGGYTERPDQRNLPIILVENPVCEGVDRSYCRPLQSNPSYSTPPNNCIPLTCSNDQVSSPNCQCAYPFTGNITLRAPSITGLGSSSLYSSLESSIMSNFTSYGLPVDSVSIRNPIRNTDNYLILQLGFFPLDTDRFNRTGVYMTAFALNNQTYKPPDIFGPYIFSGEQYNHFQGSGSSKSNTGIIIGAAVGGFVLVVLAILAGVYAFRQKKRAEKADKQNNPFALWNPDKSSGSIPQLKGTKPFTFEEMRKYSNNFSEVNDIGTGGYGKVYRGTLPDGKMIAIKRAMKGSMQGAIEFKSEIELLSRVHHKNVVSLVGFCFDQSEQMLVYEYIPNGTLKDSLSGQSGFRLDWARRLRIALGSARGLQYLHELADPPIIHRDIKSNNILLDDRLNAKVADFGLSKAIGNPDQTHITTQVKGTMGYMDPEYYMTNQLTDKSDVYSFGVTLLELVTAKQPIEKGKYIVREVRERMDKTKVLYNIQEVIDPFLLGTALDGFEKFVDVALRCVMETGADRPTMGQVVKEIENIMQLAGLNPDVESTATSANYEWTSQGFNHPYNDESLFMYSGAFPRSSLEP